MKKLLVTILIITFIAGNLGILLVPNVALAQLSPAEICDGKGLNHPEWGPEWLEKLLNCLKEEGGDEARNQWLNEESEREEIRKRNEAEAAESANCDGYLANFSSACIAEKLSNFSLDLSSWVLYFAGTLFDYTIQKTVVEMKTLVDKVNIVDIGWKVFRDFVNIFFIFILLYISISIILGLGIDTKRILIKIILIALLINFSLFITKIIIDTSNVVAVGFYDAIITQTEAISGSDSEDDSDPSNASKISQAFVDALNLTTIYNTNNVDKDGVKTPMKIATGDIVLIGIFGSLFMLVVAFVFFAGAFLFALRFIVFIFLMILAPLAFFGMILPKTQSYASKWWDSLLSQAYFAPLYMALIFVVIKGMANFKIMGKGSKGVAAEDTFAAAFNTAANDASNLGIILNFIIFMGLATGALIIAKSLSVSGSSATMKIGKGIQKWGQAKVVGAPGFAARQSIGRIADKVARGEGVVGSRLKDFASKDTFAGRQIGARALKATQKVSESGFDIRATGVGKSMDLGKATGKGGYKKKFDDKVKAEEKFAKSLGTPQYVKDRIREKRKLIEDLEERQKDTSLSKEQKAFLEKKQGEAKVALARAESPDRQRERQLRRAKSLREQRSYFGAIDRPSRIAEESAGKIEAEAKMGRDKKLLKMLKTIGEEEKKPEDEKPEEKKEDSS